MTIDNRPKCERCAAKDIDSSAICRYGICWLCGPCVIERQTVELKEKREMIIHG